MTTKSLSQGERYLKAHREHEARWLDNLIHDLAEYYKNKQQYFTDNGETKCGILLDEEACKLLVRWWEKSRPRKKGRPAKLPSLFANPFKQEFEQEIEKIKAARGTIRGATKAAIHILAERHRVQFDTMRKRIKG